MFYIYNNNEMIEMFQHSLQDFQTNTLEASIKQQSVHKLFQLYIKK